MKKQLKILMLTSCLSLLAAFPAFAGWQQTGNGQWQYEQDGAILTGQWLEDQGSWYYLDANGMMPAGTTQNIAGTDYNFDADGRWIEPAAAPVAVREGWNLYQNDKTKYSIQYPTSMQNVTASNSDLDVKSDYIFISIMSMPVSSDINPSYLSENIRKGYANSGITIYQSQSETQINGYAFTKYHFTHIDGKTKMDLFVRYDSSTASFYGIAAGYLDHSKASAMEIVSTYSLVR